MRPSITTIDPRVLHTNEPAQPCTPNHLPRAHPSIPLATVPLPNTEIHLVQRGPMTVWLMPSGRPPSLRHAAKTPVPRIGGRRHIIAHPPSRFTPLRDISDQSRPTVAITKTRAEGGAERYLTVTPRVRPHATRTVVGSKRMEGLGDLQVQAQVHETPLPLGITLHTASLM